MKQIVKGILWILFILALFAASQAKALTPDDLLEGDRIAQGRCVTTTGQMTYCMVVSYRVRQYLVILNDDFDPTTVYDITGQSVPYDVRELLPVWPDKGTI